MMDEWNQAGKADGKERSLDTQLEAFYGPALSEQPLPGSSWLKLRSRLDAHQPRQRRMSRRWHFRHYTGRGRVPLFVQGAFTRIMYEARFPYNASMLRCVIRPRISVPEVRVSLLPRRQIGLFLPSPLEGSVEPTMLDVLLATGLARYVTMRRANYILPRLLLVSVVLFAYAMLILSHWLGVPPNTFLIAIGLCIVLSIGVVWVMGRQRRTMAVWADSLMVQWLGRGRACQGLHVLADWSRAPSRKRWGELSITERIGRVCGTQVSLEQERLTLVR
jgi:hypothetical protein